MLDVLIIMTIFALSIGVFLVVVTFFFNVKLNNMSDQNALVLSIVQEINVSTSNIAADIDRILAREGDSLTPETIAELQAASDALKAVAAKVPEPE